MQEVQKNMLVETMNGLASKVLLSEEFTKGENSPFEKVEPHKNSTAIGGQSEQAGNLWTTQEK